jgi:putative FmdB family regulatory protein
MPTYEYVCRACGHSFDIVQAMRDEALTRCPECGGELRKVFAPPAISFKGSGFYSNDHGKSSRQPSEKPAETTAASTGTTSGTDKGDKGVTGAKKEPAEPSGKKAPSSSGAGSAGKTAS